jgi:membrane peptidoglycan carboxypeptidase
MGTVHGITAVTGGTFPAMIWHTYMEQALAGLPVVQFASPGAPPYQPWCGRYQFALTWRNARPSDSCSTKPKTHSTQTTTRRTTTTVQATTTTIVSTATEPTTTTSPPPPPPPPTTTRTTTTTTTGTTTTGTTTTTGG